jgi:hypothetical protein
MDGRIRTGSASGYWSRVLHADKLAIIGRKVSIKTRQQLCAGIRSSFASQCMRTMPHGAPDACVHTGHACSRYAQTLTHKLTHTHMLCRHVAQAQTMQQTCTHKSAVKAFNSILRMHACPTPHAAGLHSRAVALGLASLHVSSAATRSVRMVRNCSLSSETEVPVGKQGPMSNQGAAHWCRDVIYTSIP